MSEFRIHHDVNELLSLLRVHGGEGAEVYIELLQKNRTPYVTTNVSAHSAKVCPRVFLGIMSRPLGVGQVGKKKKRKKEGVIGSGIAVLGVEVREGKGGILECWWEKRTVRSGKSSSFDFLGVVGSRPYPVYETGTERSVPRFLCRHSSAHMHARTGIVSCCPVEF